MKLRFPQGSRPKSGNTYLIAVSGGVDSMCLLDLFVRTVPKGQFAVAHFNHRVRRDSDKDQELVEAYCRRQRLKLFLGKRSGRGHLSEEKLRDLRHSFLEEVASTSGFSIICTAHHANDQLETILMRLCRGTGLRGMRGIRTKRGQWIRPLLKYSRHQIEEYAQRRKVPFQVDSSNEDTRYFRNSIRHRVVPRLLDAAGERGFSEKAVLSNLSHWCEEATKTYAFMRKHAEASASQISQVSAFWVRVSLEDWKAVPKALKPLVLTHLAESHLGVTLNHRQRTLWQQNLKRGIRQFHLEGGVRVRVSMGYWYLMLSQERPRSPSARAVHGTHVLDEIGVELILEQTAELEVRYFQSGDRLARSGKKLKSVFQSLRVPAPERPWWPVVAAPNSSLVYWYLRDNASTLPVRLNRCDFPFLQ